MIGGILKAVNVDIKGRGSRTDFWAFNIEKKRKRNQKGKLRRNIRKTGGKSGVCIFPEVQFKKVF